MLIRETIKAVRLEEYQEIKQSILKAVNSMSDSSAPQVCKSSHKTMHAGPGATAFKKYLLKLE